MTKNWDSGNDSTDATPNGKPNQRAIEYYSTGSTNIWLWIDGVGELWYSHGADATWTDTQLTAANTDACALTHQSVTIENASIAIDHNNDHVHICYSDGTHIYHAQCTTPLTPTSANWTTYTSNEYQQVDNSTNTKGTCSISVDGDTANDDPHIVWDEDNTGWEVHYNYGSGTDHAFTSSNEITLANGGEIDPTIMAIEETGKDLYVFWNTASGGTIECTYCPDASAPLTGANWGGPVAGAGSGPDTVMTDGIGDTGFSAPSAAYWWDTDTRIMVTAVAGPTTDDIHTRVYDESTSAWLTERTITGMTGTPTESMCQNIDNANEWRIVYVASTTMYHGYKAGDDFTSGVTWYQLATTASSSGTFFSCEWRDRSDAATAEDRTTAVWKDSSDNLWYSHIRPNTTPTTDSLDSPINGAYVDETGTINFDWTFLDTDGDLQREYYAEIDDDSGFGSTVADPGSGMRLNTWTASALETQTLNASVLSANDTYYWRVKVRDDEYGSEYDPNSEGSFPTYEDFKTTPQIGIVTSDTDQKADKSVACDINLTLPTGMYSGTAEITLAEYNDGSWSTMTADSTYHSPANPASIPISAGTTYVVYGWDADSDLAADWEANVSVRFTVRWLLDRHALGTVNDDLASQFIDFDDPDSPTIGNPDGGTVSTNYPTLNCTATDGSGYEVKFEVHRDSGYTDLLEASGYQGVGTTSYQMAVQFDRTGTWYFRAKTRDGSPSQNENTSWTTGDFTYSPPSDPVECNYGVMNLEVDPTKEWDGSEFNVLDLGDVIGTISVKNRVPGPNTLSFHLNNYDGRYMDASSSYYIKKGDEVKFTRDNLDFFGTVTSITSNTSDSRMADIYCESFSSATSSLLISLRVRPTDASGLYWEDYIKSGLTSAGLIPKIFKVVNSSGDEIHYSDAGEKTPVLGTADIAYSNISPVAFLNDIVARTGKRWYEDSTIPTGRKSTLYWLANPNPDEDTTDYSFDIDTEILEERIEWDDNSLVNRVVYTDADVVEQDMNSIREYGIHLHTMSRQGIEDPERLIELAQYIIGERAVPRASGMIPIEGEHEVPVNSLVEIHEDGVDDAKSGFAGSYIVVAVEKKYGRETTTNLTLTSRWENPTVRELVELFKRTSDSSADDPIIHLRVETGEVRVACPDEGASLGADTTHVAARLGQDRYSDEDTDSNYYSLYGAE